MYIVLWLVVMCVYCSGPSIGVCILSLGYYWCVCCLGAIVCVCVCVCVCVRACVRVYFPGDSVDVCVYIVLELVMMCVYCSGASVDLCILSWGC